MCVKEENGFIMSEKIDDFDNLDYYFDSHSRYYHAVLPCGHRIDRLNNEVVNQLLSDIKVIMLDIAVIKRQISAHDRHIESVLRGNPRDLL